jgi:formyl-CoA transferase
VLKCKGWQTDPNAYIYFTIQGQNWANTCKAIDRPEWIDDPAYNTATARQDKIFDIFGYIETWLEDRTKFEAVDVLREYDVPCAPVMSMKDIVDDPSLRASGSIVEVEHKTRGKYLTVGSPIKFSELTVEITGSPLLGEHSDEVLASLGYDSQEIAQLHAEKVV